MSNTKLWDSHKSTSPNDVYHALYNDTPYTGIRTIAAIKAATTAFGVFGDGWGYKLGAEKTIDIQPIFNKDGSLSEQYTKLYVVDFQFWVKDLSAFPLFKASSPLTTVQVDGTLRATEDFQIKAVNAAIKRSLMMLGFFADVYEGKFDNDSYADEQSLKDESNKIISRPKQIVLAYEELDEWIDKSCERYSQITSAGNLARIHKTTLHSLKEKCLAIDATQKPYIAKLNKAFDMAKPHDEEYCCTNCGTVVSKGENCCAKQKLIPQNQMETP